MAGIDQELAGIDHILAETDLWVSCFTSDIPEGDTHGIKKGLTDQCRNWALNRQEMVCTFLTRHSFDDRTEKSG